MGTYLITFTNEPSIQTHSVICWGSVRADKIEERYERGLGREPEKRFL